MGDRLNMFFLASLTYDYIILLFISHGFHFIHALDSEEVFSYTSNKIQGGGERA